MKPFALTAALAFLAVGCGRSSTSTVQSPPQASTVASLVAEEPLSPSGEPGSLLGQQYQTVQAEPKGFVSKMPEIRFDDYPATRLRGPSPDVATGVILCALPGEPMIREGATLWSGGAVQPVTPIRGELDEFRKQVAGVNVPQPLSEDQKIQALTTQLKEVEAQLSVLQRKGSGAQYVIRDYICDSRGVLESRVLQSAGHISLIEK